MGISKNPSKALLLDESHYHEPSEMNFLKRLWNLGKKVFPKTFLEIEYLRRNKNFEKDLWLVRNFCDQSSISVDVGVNQGIFSRFMAKFSKEVLSFECNDLLYSTLHRVLPGNTKLCKVVLSDRSGLAQLRFDPQNTGIGTIEENNLLMNNSGIKQVTTPPSLFPSSASMIIHYRMLAS